MKIAFCDKDGDSHQIVNGYFSKCILIPCESFEAVFEVVDSNQADSGLIPIENALTGSIHQNYDLLFRYNLFIVEEHFLHVSHCLIGFPGVKKEELTRVVSPQQDLEQCDNYVHGLNITVEVVTDLAVDVALIKSKGIRTTAAIASYNLAEAHRMEVIEKGIDNYPRNYTRFVALSRKSIIPRGYAKTSIVFVLPNHLESLYDAIGAFARRDIDLTKIESRPLIGQPWNYVFYFDIAGATHEESVDSAIEELGNMATMVRVLGSYPRAKISSSADDT